MTDRFVSRRRIAALSVALTLFSAPLAAAQTAGRPPAGAMAGPGMPRPQAAPQKQMTPAELKALQQKAQQGDAAAQFSLGVKCQDGEGVPQDYAQAAAWWRKAAEQGHADAQSKLAVAYAKGQGVPEDYAQAAA